MTRLHWDKDRTVYQMDQIMNSTMTVTSEDLKEYFMDYRNVLRSGGGVYNGVLLPDRGQVCFVEMSDIFKYDGVGNGGVWYTAKIDSPTKAEYETISEANHKELLLRYCIK